MTRRTSTALACLLGLALSASAFAHDPTQMAQAQLEEKLKKPWLTTNGFVPDFDKALGTANKDKKAVFAYFTISYWNDPACEKVETGVLSSPEFKKFGEKDFFKEQADRLKELETPAADGGETKDGDGAK